MIEDDDDFVGDPPPADPAWVAVDELRSLQAKVVRLEETVREVGAQVYALREAATHASLQRAESHRIGRVLIYLTGAAAGGVWLIYMR